MPNGRTFSAPSTPANAVWPGDLVETTEPDDSGAPRTGVTADFLFNRFRWSHVPRFDTMRSTQERTGVTRQAFGNDLTWTECEHVTVTYDDQHWVLEEAYESRRIEATSAEYERVALGPIRSAQGVGGATAPGAAGDEVLALAESGGVADDVIDGETLREAMALVAYEHGLFATEVWLAGQPWYTAAAVVESGWKSAGTVTVPIEKSRSETVWLACSEVMPYAPDDSLNEEPTLEPDTAVPYQSEDAADVADPTDADADAAAAEDAADQDDPGESHDEADHVTDSTDEFGAALAPVPFVGAPGEAAAAAAGGTGGQDAAGAIPLGASAAAASSPDAQDDSHTLAAAAAAAAISAAAIGHATNDPWAAPGGSTSAGSAQPASSGWLGGSGSSTPAAGSAAAASAVSAAGASSAAGGSGWLSGYETPAAATPPDAPAPTPVASTPVASSSPPSSAPASAPPPSAPGTSSDGIDRVPPPVPPPAQPPSRGRGLIIGASIVLVLLVLGVAGLVSQPRGGNSDATASPGSSNLSSSAASTSPTAPVASVAPTASAAPSTAPESSAPSGSSEPSGSAAPSASATPRPSGLPPYQLPTDPQQSVVLFRLGTGGCQLPATFAAPVAWSSPAEGQILITDPTAAQAAIGTLGPDGSFDAAGGEPLRHWQGTLTDKGGTGRYQVVSGTCTETYDVQITFQ